MTEREYSRCDKCGKRLAWLGPPQPRPCPREADDPAYCTEVMNSLVLARRLRTEGSVKDPYHQETLDLLARSGIGWSTVDAQIARLNKIDADERLLRYGSAMLHPVADWINGDRDRAEIVCKWALSQINVCDGSTVGEIHRMLGDLSAAVSEHVLSLADDIEADVERAGP